MRDVDSGERKGTLRKTKKHSTRCAPQCTSYTFVSPSSLNNFNHLQHLSGKYTCLQVLLSSQMLTDLPLFNNIPITDKYSKEKIFRFPNNKMLKSIYLAVCVIDNSLKLVYNSKNQDPLGVWNFFLLICLLKNLSSNNNHKYKHIIADTSLLFSHVKLNIFLFK